MGFGFEAPAPSQAGGRLFITKNCSGGRESSTVKIMDGFEQRIDELLYALDEAIYPEPPDDLCLLVSLIAKCVDEHELSEVMNL
jgi:hypothetical protein